MFTETLEKLGQEFGGVKQYLSGLQYPVNKQNLVQFAQSKGANPMIISLLGKLPERQYQNEQEVSQEVSNAAQSEPAAATPAQ